MICPVYVFPSVCMSLVKFLSKRPNTGSPKQYRMIRNTSDFTFLFPKIFVKFQWVYPQLGTMYMRDRKNLQVSVLCHFRDTANSLYLENGTRQTHSFHLRLKNKNCKQQALVFYRTRVYQMQPRNGQNS